MLISPLTYHNPKTAQEAAQLISELQNARIQAGGTFLLNSLKQLKARGAKTPDHIIGLNKVDELKGIETDKETCIIKAMTTIDEINAHQNLPDDLEFLKLVTKNISTQPIRNMASFGGNLTCRYTWTELPAVIIALDAKMHFTDQKGKLHSIDAEEFYKNQAKSEFLFTHISFKRPIKAKISYQRVRKSASIDIPLLSLLVKTEINNGQLKNTRVGINNCVQFAQRDKKLEAFLDGKKADPAIIEGCLENLELTIYDTRSSDYKKHMFRVCIKNALNEIIS